MPNDHPIGFVWYELMTHDGESASRFYAHVIGWQAHPNRGAAGMPYTVLSANGVHIGGIWGQLAGDHPPSWIGYLGTPDLDHSLAQATAAGGSIVKQATEIPAIGRFAILADPAGAHFILFQGHGQGAAPPPAEPGALGHAAWHELQSSDPDGAWRFYSSLYGWGEAGTLDMGEHGTYRMFTTGGAAPVGGIMRRMPEVPVSFWLFYFQVDGAESAAARITSAGGKVVMGPHQISGGGWIVQATDPQGAHFAVVASSR